MNLGRPHNRRKRVLRTLMNEKEEEFFLEYLEDWETNREVSRSLKKNSPKKICTTVGDYCKKFLNKEWLDKTTKRIEYHYRDPNNKKRAVYQSVPTYKSNIKPFIDYFTFTADDLKLNSLFSDKYAISLLYLFFDLQEVRKYFSLISKMTIEKPLNIYAAFLDTLERKLIYYWLYFNKKFYPNLKKMVIIEEFSINQIPEVQEIKFLIEEYLKDKKSDFAKSRSRREIIDIYNSSWEKFEKLSCFKKMIIKLNALQNKGFNRKMLKDEIKIKYFARLLYVESSMKAIRESFLGFVANSLIQMQPKKEQDSKYLKLLKYQLFNKVSK